MDQWDNTFGYTPPDPKSGQEAVFIPEEQESAATEAEEETAEELVQGWARPTEPGEFPPDYWAR